MFHCTTDYHGDVWEPEPRTPSHRAECEPDTPRVCVAPTVASCFAARLFAPEAVAVYRSRAKPEQPVGVWDQCITGEMWYTRPVKFRLHTLIREEVVSAIMRPILSYHTITGKRSSWRLRVCQFAIAVAELDERKSKSAAKRMLEFMHAKCPWDYLRWLIDKQTRFPQCDFTCHCKGLLTKHACRYRGIYGSREDYYV